jgi:hypothetical protein
MKDSSESEQLRTVTSVALGKCAIPLTASSVQYQPYTRHTPHATRHTPHATRHTPHATRHTRTHDTR